MDLENLAAKQAYMHLLIDTLGKKIKVLHQLIELTQQQEALITADSFDEDNFLRLIALKEDQLKLITMLDDGFEQLYASVKEELAAQKTTNSEMITELKEKITVITDLSVKLQTMELRNKSKIEAAFASKRRNIMKSKISAQTATSYYKTMAQQQEAQSYFYDKKK